MLCSLIGDARARVLAGRPGAHVARHPVGGAGATESCCRGARIRRSFRRHPIQAPEIVRPTVFLSVEDTVVEGAAGAGGEQVRLRCRARPTRVVEGAARAQRGSGGILLAATRWARTSRRAMRVKQTAGHDVDPGHPEGGLSSVARWRSLRSVAGHAVGASPAHGGGPCRRSRGAGRRASLARCRNRRPLPRLAQRLDPRPTSGGPAASVSLQHGPHLRALRCRLPEGSRLPHYPPRHHAPEGPGFCGQLLTQLPVSLCQVARAPVPAGVI